LSGNRGFTPASEPGATPAPILFVHYGEEWIRGSERCLLDLFTYLDRDRFRPILWCNAETLASEARKLDVEVEVSRFTVLLGWAAPRYDVANYWRLVRRAQALIKTHNIRLVHANSAAPTQWMFVAAHRERVPLLTHVHVPYVERDRFTLGMHRATLSVGVTQGCVADLIADGLPEERTATIHNAVDVASWDGWDETGLRARLGIGEDDVVITQTGSLIHRKGHDLLLHALKKLRETHANCHFLIVGDGPERKEIERLTARLGLEDVVHFLGFVPSPHAGVIFRDATDIAVSPSRMEGFGLTVIEAGAAGCAVLATATTGMTEIITHEVNGLIVPVEDPERLLAGLSRLVEDRSLRDRLGAALKEEVMTRFVVSKYVTDFEATYTRLMELPKEQLGWRRSRWSGQRRMYARWVIDAARRRAGRVLSPR
jgi:glycosyltransferase involved in cell wall biosynthesis